MRSSSFVESDGLSSWSLDAFVTFLGSIKKREIVWKLEKITAHVVFENSFNLDLRDLAIFWEFYNISCSVNP